MRVRKLFFKKHFVVGLTTTLPVKHTYGKHLELKISFVHIHLRSYIFLDTYKIILKLYKKTVQYFLRTNFVKVKKYFTHFFYDKVQIKFR